MLSIANGHYADVAKDLAAVADGTAPKTRRQAMQTINGMLGEDETSATLSTTEGAEIIAFPGMSVPVTVRTKAQVALLGELYQISGSSNKACASVRIQTAAYGAVFCQTPFTKAKELSKFLFEHIKVSGRGVWKRSALDGWRRRTGTPFARNYGLLYRGPHGHVARCFPGRLRSARCCRIYDGHGDQRTVRPPPD